jgi:hypothetical protein
MLRGETAQSSTGPAPNTFSVALDRKGSAGRPLRAPDSSGNFGLNLVDQGYRARLIKVTAHIHWKDPKQERSMEVDFREVCFCSERPDGLSSVHRRGIG